MGNCQAAEAATVVIEHPGGRPEMVCRSLSASQVMASNPGYYVAIIITSNKSNSSSSSNSGQAVATVKHLKLLRPDDTLNIGHVYRLVSFEDVLKEFGSRKHIRLNKLLAKEKHKRSDNQEDDRGGGGGGVGAIGHPTAENSHRMEEDDEEEVVAEEEEDAQVRGLESSHDGGIMGSSITSIARLKQGQWRPTLQTITEVGS